VQLELMADTSMVKGSRRGSTMDRTDAAASRFAEGYNCSQAVLSAYAPILGLAEETALKIASGFGGGMGRMAETCGAVTGALMVLGLKHGTTSPDREARERVYEQVREFAKRFKARNGSLLCRELLSCDLSTPEGLQQARDADFVSKICPKFVRDAAEILEEMLKA
jgi:C_GCAxxG_C_C family probable redox protein